MYMRVRVSACVWGAMCSPIISWNKFLEIEIQIGRKVFVPIFHRQGYRGGVGRGAVHTSVCVDGFDWLVEKKTLVAGE